MTGFLKKKNLRSLVHALVWELCGRRIEGHCTIGYVQLTGQWTRDRVHSLRERTASQQYGLRHDRWKVEGPWAASEGQLATYMRQVVIRVAGQRGISYVRWTLLAAPFVCDQLWCRRRDLRTIRGQLWRLALTAQTSQGLRRWIEKALWNERKKW